MKSYREKPYHPGYVAPLTGEAFTRRAVLEMEEEGFAQGHDVQILEAPPHLTLRLDMRLHFYEGAVPLERGVNGKSAGITPLYQPGNVLSDGSENLKPLCKVRAVDFVYLQRGMYVDVEEVNRPFYEGHGVAALIQLVLGQVVFQKPFAGRADALRLETHLRRQDRDEWTEVIGFGRETYPLYPYGGYAPPHGDVREVEQVYAFAGVDRSDGQMVTALKLYRSSFFHTSGGFPPTPFTYDHKKWVFPQGVLPLEQMTVGQALSEGHLTFTLKEASGEVQTYASYGYEQVGGSMSQINVHCQPQ